MRDSKTIPELFLKQLLKSKDREAIRFFHGNQLVSLNWTEVAFDVWSVFKQINAFDLMPGSRIAHLSENRYEWIVVDLAIQFGGFVHVPIHQHLSSEQMELQIVHSDSVLTIVSPGLMTRLARRSSKKSDRGVIVLERLDNRPNSTNIETIVAELSATAVSPQDLVSIMYTSGTTGQPNGVMLSHANVISNIEGKLDALPLYPDDVRLAFLPMTHIFSRTCDIYTWIASGSILVISKGREHVLDECKIVKPTYLNAVPFFYQRCYETASGRRNEHSGTELRELLGGEIRLCNCGGAPLDDEVFDYFHDHGVMLVTGYGLTETSPVLTSNRPDSVKKGTVGPALKNVELRLDHDGELLARGPNIFKGYWKAPTKTDSCFENDWFRTGDLATIDDEGFVTIVGRKKEMILTTGGFNIFPAPIEAQLVKSSLVEQCVVIGDRRDYLVALVLPSEETKVTSRSKLIKNIMEEFRQLQTGFSKYEQIGNVMLLDEPLSIENGLMTPKSSLRRKEIENRYAEQIEEVYSSSYNSGNTS